MTDRVDIVIRLDPRGETDSLCCKIDVAVASKPIMIGLQKVLLEIASGICHNLHEDLVKRGRSVELRSEEKDD